MLRGIRDPDVPPFRTEAPPVCTEASALAGARMGGVAGIDGNGVVGDCTEAGDVGLPGHDTP